MYENRIKMVTEDLSDGNVKIAISVNGTEVLSKVTDDSTDKLTDNKERAELDSARSCL